MPKYEKYKKYGQGNLKSAPESYIKRDYRRAVGAAGFSTFQVKVRETDLFIMAPADVHGPAYDLVRQYRNQLENYINHNPSFQSSLLPLDIDRLAPPIVKDMLKASAATGVGPMAAVAGAVAEYVGGGLLAGAGIDEVVVENGGDIFLQRREDCQIAIFAGPSPLSNKVGVKVKAAAMPMGICTSSASVGHSLSFGAADAVTVLAADTALADAAATRLGNEVGRDCPLSQALDVAREISGIRGVVIIRGEDIGAWGEIELVDLT